jgi:hypothetical protein
MTLEATETPYKRAKILSVTDAAYIAGLIDGEGTVTLSRRHAGDKRQVVVSISNTDRRLLQWVAEQIGAGKITGKRVSSAAHSPGFTFAISNRQALALLDQTSGYLRTYKRVRAELILASYINLTPRNGKYTDDIACRRSRFEQEVMQLGPKWAGPRIDIPWTA